MHFSGHRHTKWTLQRSFYNGASGMFFKCTMPLKFVVFCLTNTVSFVLFIANFIELLFRTHENCLLQKEVLLRWQKTKKQLLEILQESAKVCQIEGKINQAPYEYKQDKYFHSCW